MSDESLRFTCDGCGRQFRWKAALAGKRVKCTCGQPINVPSESEIKGVREEEEDDVYAMKEVDESAQGPVAGVGVTPAGAPKSAGALGYGAPAAPLSYGRPASAVVGLAGEGAGSRQDLWRNVWFPTILLAGGFLATSAWGALNGIASGLIVIWVLLFVAMVPVLGIFLIYGLAQAKKRGLTMRSLGTAAFKLLSIVFLTDAAVVWVFQFLAAVGAVGRGGGFRGLRLILVLLFFCVSFVIKASSQLLFGAQEDDFVAAGLPLAGASWVAHFVVLIAMLVGLGAMLGGAGSASGGGGGGGTPVAVAPSDGGGDDSTASPAAPGAADENDPRSPGFRFTKPRTRPAGQSAASGERLPSARERDLLAAMNQGIAVREGREWRQTRVGDDRKTDALVRSLYAAGASGVFVDLRAVRGGRPMVAYAFAEWGSETRAKCEEAYQGYLAENRLPPRAPRGEEGSRVMVFELQ